MMARKVPVLRSLAPQSGMAVRRSAAGLYHLRCEPAPPWQFLAPQGPQFVGELTVLHAAVRAVSSQRGVVGASGWRKTGRSRPRSW